MSLYKLPITHFVSDMDGTLLNSIKKIDSRDADAILIWQKLGHTFLLASGRDKSVLQKIREEYCIDIKEMICHNGASLVSDGKVLYSKQIDHAAVIKLIEAVKPLNSRIDYVIPTQDGRKYILHHTGIFHERVVVKENVVFQESPLPVSAYEQETNKTATKVFLMVEDSETELQLFTLLKEKDIFSDLAVMKSGNLCFEICRREVNKGSTLRYMADHMNIDMRGIAAIGDAENDVEMLKIAGHSFVMSHASDSIRKYGKSVDSVSEAIMQCIAFNKSITGGINR